ncbi:MAG TPA: acyl-CoA dehydrogenase family protein, partial [Longimicrobiales bacterium]|nr:acyl-CoA dehydrogenase family protein [Longimicrobiales bacterium]
MHSWFHDHHERFRAEIREFAAREIAPVARELDADSRFPWENVRLMAERGWFGVNVPEEYGGMGRDYISYILLI